ncbi:hypothetical protein [Chitinimonas koreensis]|uniref:hypothetical protein n=1 Tax=Chitinimonas koreensis TaxID=356302 RepID=UPI00048C0FA8|nr:hypothetical protein [Chitinimonas koreensis]QNM98497.1 hypothetical protein H9L41_09845 [Chitinimonas koreensis]
MTEAAVLAVAGDPGGANALAPVLDWLQGQGVRLHCAGYRQAPALWTARGLAVETLAEAGFDPAAWLVARRREQGAALLLTTTSANGLDYERALWDAARADGLPSLALLDFWSNYPLRFRDPAGAWHWPDCIAAMDQASAEALRALGAPQAAATGQPALDRLAALRAGFDPARRAALRQQAGAAGTALLYASQPLAELHGGEAAARAALGFSERDAWRDLAAQFDAMPAPPTVWLRPHPRERADDWRAEAARHPWARLLEGGDSHEWALAADGVLGMGSMLLLEACLLGRPVLSYQPGLPGEDALPSNRLGWSRAVYRRDQLAAALSDWLARLPAPQLAPPDGLAAERVGRLALRLGGMAV